MPENSTSTYAAATAPDVASYDLAVVTAMQVELEPVLKLIGGRDQWKELTIDGYLHYVAVFPCGPRPLRVVACSLSKYGGTAAAVQVQRLKDLHPRLIVMTGICAGRKDKGIRLGDVIVADRAFNVKEGGKETQAGFMADIRTYNTRPQLLQWLKDFAKDPNWHKPMTTPRPSSLEYQAEWLLCQLANQGIGFPATPADWEALKTNHIDLPLARQRLRGMKLLSSKGQLTALARKRIDELRDKNYGQILPTPDSDHPKAHVNAFASGDAVVAIERPFDEAAGHLRSVGAVEMEVPALYDAAEQLGVRVFAVKGVSDYATPEKDDAFHEYAAEASARWMYAFICRYAALLDQALPGPQTPPTEARPQAPVLPAAAQGHPDLAQGGPGKVHELTQDDRFKLAELLQDSGRAAHSSRNALCIEIGIDPGRLAFMQAADRDFAIQLVAHLYRTGFLPALLQLCEAIAPELDGQSKLRLAEIRAKLS